MLALKVMVGRFVGFILMVGSFVGFILPKEVTARSKIRKEDELNLMKASTLNHFLATNCRLAVDNPDFERQLRLAEDIMRQDYELLRALAQ